ncbi:unnamed protein product [marine sediment metagenome]|uniref:Uncharacterized protein n=1 Tax=marine sediment metagenome TaxID=412755 RepID=X1UYL1_9ZZZZ
MTETYSEIISITAPSSASEGEQVPISTEVKNISAYSLLFRVDLFAVKDIYEVPTPEETIGSIEVAIGSGQSYVVSGMFIMPAWDANIVVKVYRFIDYWDFDTYATKVVSLVVAQDWMSIIAPILVLGLLAGLMVPMMKGAFK